MKSWTIGEMLNERPCTKYTQERITELWAGRERLTLLEVLDLPILAEDIVWVICRKNALTPEQQAEWLECIVTRAIRNHALNCGILTVEAWARNWLNGSDRSLAEAAAAAAAAWAAEAAWARNLLDRSDRSRAEAEAAAAVARAAAAAWAAETEAEATRAAVRAAAAREAALAAREAEAAAAWAAEAEAAAAAAWAAAAEERERQVQDCREILTQEDNT